MRLSRFAIPFSIALLCAGLVMYLSARPNPNPNQDFGIDFGQPKHPVTAKMIMEANKMTLLPAPPFERPDVKGEMRQVSGARLQRPQLVLFILDTCPCSIDAQPLFNVFSKHWQGKVDFLGVINVDTKKGRDWSSDYRPVFPVLPDPKLEIIKAYRAKQSVYSVLISKEGKIVKLWPGYSQDLLKEMNDTIAREVGEEPRAFDAQYAPADKTSGCYFE